MDKNQMTIEEIATQIIAAIISNPASIASYHGKDTMMHDIVRDAIACAKELKMQLAGDVSVNYEPEQVTIDADFEIIKE